MDDVSPAALWLTYAELGDERSVTPRSDSRDVVWEAIRDAVIQLEGAEQRVEDDRALAHRARDRAEEVERLQAGVIAGLEAELAKRRVSEQAARDDTAAARNEATGLKAELEALKARGWWARLRNK